jgi:uncharacterized membrane protein
MGEGVAAARAVDGETTRAVEARSMESRLKVLGHPVHPMLVMFPVALLVTTVLFDLIDTLGGPRFLGEVA